MFNLGHNWNKIKILKTGGQAEISLYSDLNDIEATKYIAKKALKPEFSPQIEKEHKILQHILYSGFQFAIDSEVDNAGNFTSYRRYLDGESLDEFLKHNPNYFANNEENFLNFSLKLANLIHHLHKNHNLIHRDIKPQNILYNPDLHNVSLIDLGITLKINEQGIPAGTAPWCCSDQLEKKSIAKEVHDLYSFSKILLWILNLELTNSFQGYLDLNIKPMERKKVPDWLGRNLSLKLLLKECTNCINDFRNYPSDINNFIKNTKNAISTGNRVKKVYDSCPNPNCGVNILPNLPICYSCLTPLIHEQTSTICVFCGREIPDKKLSEHYFTVHSDQQNNKQNYFTCSICHWSTQDNELAKQHNSVCKINDPILKPIEPIFEEIKPFKIFNTHQENPKSLIAFSISGILFETLEVYRSLNIKPYDHQEDTVLKSLRDFGGRCIISDSVGLGKTIECGIILSELLFRELINSALIIVPNFELQGQWLEELDEKFQLGPDNPHGFNIWTLGSPRPKTGDRLIIEKRHLNVGSYKLFINDNISWDILIVDEAHEIGNNIKGLIWNRIYQIQTKYLFFVTATPMKKKPSDLYPLIYGIDRIIAGDSKKFEKNYNKDVINPNDVNKLKALLSQVMVRHTRNDVHSVTFPSRKAIIKFSKFEKDYQLIYENLKKLIKSKSSNVKTNSNKLLKKFNRLVIEFLDSLKEEEILEFERLLPDSELRIWKNLLKNANTISITNDPKIDTLVNIIETYFSTGFLESLGQTNSDHSELSPVLVFVGSNRGRNLVLKILKDRFSEKRRIEGFTENMTGRARRDLLNKYNTGQIDVLVCGTSQSRGLNLQKGFILINLDLPESPIEIEQRIGRVERLEQKKGVVFIINLMYETIEEKFRWNCYNKYLLMFQEVVGDTDLVNLFTAVDVVNRIEELNMKIMEGIENENKIEKLFEELGNDILAVRDVHLNLLPVERSPEEELDNDNFTSL
jgi:superfamily II DNA or RNA helicase